LPTFEAGAPPREAGNVDYVHHQPPRKDDRGNPDGGIRDRAHEAAHGQRGPQAAIPDSAEAASGEAQNHEDDDKNASRAERLQTEQPYEYERDERRNPGIQRSSRRSHKRKICAGSLNS
jgi:hypothetical protein